MTGRPPSPGMLAQARAMSETVFKAKTLALAQGFGWWRHHGLPTVRDGRHFTAQQGEKGWPDLFLLHPTGAAAAVEEKTQAGSCGPGQREWGRRFEANPGVLYLRWRPISLVTGEVAALLADPRRVLALAAEQARQAGAAA